MATIKRVLAKAVFIALLQINVASALTIGYEDVPEHSLHLVFPNFLEGQDNDPETWLIAANRYANSRGYQAGYPNWEIGRNRVHGVYFISGTIWEDHSELELHSAYSEFKLGINNEPDVWFRAAVRLADRKGALFGAFPTYEIGVNRIRGIHFIPPSEGSYFYDATEAELHTALDAFIPGEDNSFVIWARAVNRNAINSHGCLMGIPNFEIGQNRVRGVFCLNNVRDTCNGILCTGISFGWGPPPSSNNKPTPSPPQSADPTDQCTCNGAVPTTHKVKCGFGNNISYQDGTCWHKISTRSKQPCGTVCDSDYVVCAKQASHICN